MRILAILALIIATPVVAQQQAPNHLLGQNSPYLRQHLYNVVDWYPWGEEALEKAQLEGKPIFLSVGYASCHWCHVMEEESFEDETIGAFLNEHFISIKMDREERPDLDEQFMLMTQTVAGSGGWPNSVFLTSEAAPFYGGTYFPPDTFLSILAQIEELWRKDRAGIEASAQELSEIVRAYLVRKARARPLTPELVRSVAQRMLLTMDEFNGGFGVAPKFPQESSLLFLLDLAEREADEELLEVVKLAAIGMINGGLHDQVGGGFHRYTIDNDWSVPHFEKMLYNQALIGRLLLRLDGLQPDPAFERAAKRAFDYVLRDMQAPDGGFYAAEDADSLTENGEREEGVFYVWTRSQIRAAATDEAEFLIGALNVREDGNFEGSNTLRSIGFSGDLLRLDAGLERLRLSRSDRVRPRLDNKILMGWNAEMIKTLAKAAEVYNRPDYLAAAQRAATFIMLNMREEEGYLRVTVGREANIAAQLPDYAGFGRALVALHDVDPEGGWLNEAERIAHYLVAHFQEESGVFRMNATPEGLGPFLPFDDGEVPSGNAQAQRLFSALARRSPDAFFIQQASALADTLSGNALTAPEQRAAAIAAVDAQNRGDVGLRRSVAHGAVQVQAEIDREAGRVTLAITVAEGWHINAHKPLEDYFIPTEVFVNDTALAADAYPEPLITTLAFNRENPLALYDGKLHLSAPIVAGGNTVKLALQSCSDEICLAPEILTFSFW